MSHKHPACLYTVCRHSGYVFSGSPEFAFALESKAIPKSEAGRVSAAGGIVFQTYAQAEDYCDRETAAADGSPFVYRARGRFSHETVGGLPIYVPPPVKA